MLRKYYVVWVNVLVFFPFIFLGAVYFVNKGETNNSRKQ